MQNSKKHTNRLIDETSPYLLQHAHNPVDWYPWCEDAFAKAQAEDKAVLVSIGYSACHWCHVMEHESFEDEVTAAVMNEHFVSIKVDMEERPDVDQIYMNFVQLTTGRGGWPMNVFLTPEKRPFFGGTYFPPERRYNMPSFQQVLISVADAYRDKRDELLRSANDIVAEMQRIGMAEFEQQQLTLEQLESAFLSFERTYDSTNGGFGGAPKFPQPMSLEFLLRYHYRTGNPHALEMVETTCRKMACGGIFDQLGGGFHRYAVDAVWLVPHFEKMLYDNAQLIRLYLHVYQITKDEFFKQVAIDCLEYLQREMLDTSGGFYSTQDADSEGVEGKFFVWKSDEIELKLGADDARVFNFHYDISEEGNFEEKNILNVKKQIAESAEALKLPIDELRRILDRGREKLFAAREGRVKPFRDEKILTAWNGLMLAAFAEASVILKNEEYLTIAKNSAKFMMNELQKNGRLLRSWKDGQAKLDGYLEDYANFVDGLTELYQVSGDTLYLKEAKRLAELMISEFWDNENGGFYFTSNDHEELIVRNKDFYDNATPSGNSTAADAFLKLSKLLSDDKFERFAVTILRIVAPQIGRYPGGFGRSLSALEFHLSPAAEVVIIGKPEGEIWQTVWEEYQPRKVVAISDCPSKAGTFIPLFLERARLNEKTTVYVCEGSVCQSPVTSAVELRKQLRA
ncbi:MAG: thioredoxin domain-containing protein [Pyrinomonadaceae bacterium]